MNTIQLKLNEISEILAGRTVQRGAIIIKLDALTPSIAINGSGGSFQFHCENGPDIYTPCQMLPSSTYSSWFGEAFAELPSDCVVYGKRKGDDKFAQIRTPLFKPTDFEALRIYRK